ncbi:MAG: hypothetical protein R2764_20625 [Bacteroidales bacterium]
MTKDLIKQINLIIKKGEYSKIDAVIIHQQKILKFIDTSRKKQVKRIKANEVGTRNSMLFLSILSESKNLILQSLNVLKAHRDFADSMNEEITD